MYSTAKEVHIGIQSKLNQINSNRKRTFRPEEIDEAFNSTMLKYIAERSQIKKEPTGLLETVKRYDDLRDLNVVRKYVSVQMTSYPICVLPVDYYLFESLELNINYDCNRTAVATKEKTNYGISTIAFPTPANASEYSDLKLTHITGGNTVVYDIVDYSLENLTNVDSKFMIINSILEAMEANETLVAYNFYWERFNNVYVKDSFIVVYNFEKSLTLFNLEYGSVNNDDVSLTNMPTLYDFVDKDEVPLPITNEVPTELVASKEIDNIKRNYYMYKNRHTRPLLELERNTLRIDYNVKYLPLSGYLTYIKRPVMLNLKAGIMTDFQSHIEEIIDLTVTNLSLTLSGDLQATASISAKNNQ